jgi:carbonic anhydrase
MDPRCFSDQLAQYLAFSFLFFSFLFFSFSIEHFFCSFQTARMEPILKENASMKTLREANLRSLSDEKGMEIREKLVAGQNPCAVIVACSDSRSEPGKIFHLDMGDIFVIRNAGNVMEPVAIGSIEYAVDHLKTPLVVILGHTLCGAITATSKYTKINHRRIHTVHEKFNFSVSAKPNALGITDDASLHVMSCCVVSLPL